MKRFLAGLLVVVIVLALAAPFVLGFRTEQLFRDFIASTDQRSDAIDLRVRDYQRGWFRSHASVDVDGIDRVSMFEVALAHGPLPVTHWNESVNLTPALVRIRAAAPSSRLRIYYTLALNGAQQGVIKAGRLEHDGIAIGGLELRYTLSSNHERVHLKLALRNARAATDAVSGRADAVQGVLAIKADQLRGALSFDLDALRSYDVAFTEGRGALVFSGWSADSASRILQYGMQLRARDLSARDLAGAMAGILLGEAPALLQYQPQLRLDELILTSESGALKAQGYLTIQANDAAVLRNPYLLARAVEGQLHVRVARAVALKLARVYLRLRDGLHTPANITAEAKKLLQRQVAAGILRPQNGAFTLQIRYTDGELLVNERPRFSL